MSPRARPASTYRLQLHAGFPFDAARGVVDYLAELGVTHVYSSPILRAQKGSTHGYDVCAHDEVSPELGGEDGFRALTDALRARSMGIVVDFVPNHMGIATGENAWWNDVIENGPASRYAERFDIEWSPIKPANKGRILYPVLGAQYGEALENGELVLRRSGGAFEVHYYDRCFPVAPRSLLPLLEAVLAELGSEGDDVVELASIVTATRNLPARDETAEERRTERAREKEVIKRRLEALCASSERVARTIDATVTAYGGKKGDARSFDRLDALLRDQAYRLAYWRVASEEINYRRFFDVNSLVAIRMERDDVFEAAHARVFALVGEGRIDGLRLDHTDGLYDPQGYFERLRAKGAEGLYVVAEKILEPGERLPRAWKIDGTTGYDATSLLGGVFVDGASERTFDAIYRRVTGETVPFAALVHQAKRSVILSSFASEMNMLAQSLERVSERSRRSRDLTLYSMRHAIIETIASFPVYRTYVREDGGRGPNDDRHIHAAITLAKRRAPHVDASVFDFLKDVLLLRGRVEADAEDRALRVAFTMRFQQLTGPIMAKGVEDTAFYRYARLVSQNEVGGDPARFGVPVAALHEANASRLRDWPRSTVTTSTHDTKRAEDVRARLAVLTEMPERWGACVDEWMGVAARHRRPVDEEPAPSEVDVYLFFQIVLGAWPFAGIGDRGAFTDRVAAYMEKATREAKTRTSWVAPNAAYEEATRDFVRGMLADDAFVASMGALAEETATYAATNALGQVALKLAGPGVADTYQGCELWSFDLVDPDNRRPVDYGVRRALLHQIRERTGDRAALARDLLARFADGAIKLYVTHTLLALRRDDPALFLEGGYRPIDAGEHVVAFVRERPEGPGRTGRPALVCVVPRLAWKLTRGERRWPIGDAWGDRTIPLPGGAWRDVLTGARHAVAGEAKLAEVLGSFPLAVLACE
jgi:(1->4)-alpha-D-glucan 1-alpha-D-glucosylmutase